MHFLLPVLSRTFCECKHTYFVLKHSENWFRWSINGQTCFSPDLKVSPNSPNLLGTCLIRSVASSIGDLFKGERKSGRKCYRGDFCFLYTMTWPKSQCHWLLVFHVGTRSENSSYSLTSCQRASAFPVFSVTHRNISMRKEPWPFPLLRKEILSTEKLNIKT